MIKKAINNDSFFWAHEIAPLHWIGIRPAPLRHRIANLNVEADKSVFLYLKNSRHFIKMSGDLKFSTLPKTTNYYLFSRRFLLSKMYSVSIFLRF